MNNRAKGDRYYGKKAERYETRRKKQAWWHVEQNEMRDLLSGLPNGLSVIDIPFGTGRFVPYYLEKNFKVAGLDASQDMIESARNILGDDIDRCETRVGSAMDLPYEDNEFDLLVSTRFLRDIIVFGDAKRALNEFVRVTRQFLIIQLGEAISGGRTPSDDETWGSSMSSEANEALLKDVGLEILDKRLVKNDAEENSHIHHVLCRKMT